MLAQLIFPNYCHEKAVEKFAKEIREYDGTDLINGAGLYNSSSNYQEWIHKEKRIHLGIHDDRNLVPGTTFLYMIDDEVIGIINIRHCLNEYLLNIGGHIGYSIHPNYRNKGYATIMLKEALKFCREWEITPVLVTCDKDNIASRKTIEKCGGVFENEYIDKDETILRFWIGEE